MDFDLGSTEINNCMGVEGEVRQDGNDKGL